VTPSEVQKFVKALLKEDAPSESSAVLLGKDFKDAVPDRPLLHLQPGQRTPSIPASPSGTPCVN
jgi:hypothetical protein